MHLGQVIEGARPLRVQDPVPAPLVLDLEPAFLDVDVGGAVLAHRPQLDQVDARVRLRDRVQHVEVADHVVGLRVDGVLPVDHRVRRGPLLAEVDDGVGLELADHLVGELRVAQVADIAARCAFRSPPATPLSGSAGARSGPGFRRRVRSRTACARSCRPRPRRGRARTDAAQWAIRGTRPRPAPGSSFVSSYLVRIRTSLPLFDGLCLPQPEARGRNVQCASAACQRLAG